MSATRHGTCVNCGEDIRTHKPSHDGESPCWIHDDGGMHGCGPEYGDDAVAEAAPEPGDVDCGLSDETAVTAIQESRNED